MSDKTDYQKMYKKEKRISIKENHRAEFFLNQLNEVLKFCHGKMDTATYNELRGTLGLSIIVPPKAEEGIVLN
jgi:hypothetical protein